MMSISSIQPFENWVFYQRPDTFVPPEYFEQVRVLLENPHVEVLAGPLIGSIKLPASSRALHIALSSPLCSGLSFAKYRSFGKGLISADSHKMSFDNLWVRKDLVDQDVSTLQTFYHPGLRIFALKGMTYSELFNSEGHHVAFMFLLAHVSALVWPHQFLEFAKFYWMSILFVSFGLSLRARKVWLFPLVALYHYLILMIHGSGFIYQKLKLNRGGL